MSNETKNITDAPLALINATTRLVYEGIDPNTVSAIAQTKLASALTYGIGVYLEDSTIGMKQKVILTGKLTNNLNLISNYMKDPQNRKKIPADGFGRLYHKLSLLIQCHKDIEGYLSHAYKFLKAYDDDYTQKRKELDRKYQPYELQQRYHRIQELRSQIRELEL
ncbi:MAG: hypothetical protein F6K55_03175 [Moorea sp. SIO4A3]|nr:hypothetical protein [Moorena sp. SIO4A3]